MWRRRAGRELARLIGGIVLAPVFVLVAVALVGGIFLGLTGWTSSWDEDPDAMRETSDRLTIVEASLEPLRVDGLRARAEHLGCHTSSGDLFQPSFELRWPTDPDAASAEADRLRSKLESAGWRAMPAAVGFPHVDLERDFGGWTAHAYLGWTEPQYATEDAEPGVVLSARIVGARPCTA